MRRYLNLSMCCCYIAIGFQSVQAADVIDIKTNIINNTELPKVLYIIPWKRPNQAGFSLPVPALVSPGVDLAPLDRELFQRQIKSAALFLPKQTSAAVVAPTDSAR